MSLADAIAPGADGLTQLRALMASGRRPGILLALDFDLTEVDVGRAVFAGVPGEHAYNPIGSVHGGYAATPGSCAPKGGWSRSESSAHYRPPPPMLSREQLLPW